MTHRPVRKAASLVRRHRHQLAGIERRLAADDPHLAEVFRLWDEQCADRDEPDRPPAAGPGRLILLAGTALVLMLWM